MPSVDQSDEAKKARCSRVFQLISAVCARNHLTIDETIIVASQFTGLTIATHPQISTHEPRLEVASQAMRNAHAAYLARRVVV